MSALRAMGMLVLIILATVAGFVAGALLGGVAAILVHPNDAGTDAWSVMLTSVFGGAVVGAFVELAALFKLRRPQPLTLRWIAWVGGVLLLLGVIGVVGLLTAPNPPGPPSWMFLLGSCLPVAVLIGIATASRLVFGRQRTVPEVG